MWNDAWAVWDSRPVRQGGRMVADGLTFDEAIREAAARAKRPYEERRR